jgi:hypothetical protein
MKANERLKHCGPFLKSTISVPVTSLISFTSVKLFPEVNIQINQVADYSHFTCPILHGLTILFHFLKLRIVRLLLKRAHRRFQSHRKMEKARLRKLVLPPVHSNKRHKLWYELHLPRAQS